MIRALRIVRENTRWMADWDVEFQNWLVALRNCFIVAITLHHSQVSVSRKTRFFDVIQHLQNFDNTRNTSIHIHTYTHTAKSKYKTLNWPENETAYIFCLVFQYLWPVLFSLEWTRVWNTREQSFSSFLIFFQTKGKYIAYFVIYHCSKVRDGETIFNSVIKRGF